MKNLKVNKEEETRKRVEVKGQIAYYEVKKQSIKGKGYSFSGRYQIEYNK